MAKVKDIWDISDISDGVKEVTLIGEVEEKVEQYSYLVQKYAETERDRNYALDLITKDLPNFFRDIAGKAEITDVASIDSALEPLKTYI